MLNIDNVKELSYVETAIYNFIVKNDDKVGFMRVRDIANGSHTSPTSVMRFIKKSGFNSFPEFKLYIKNNIKTSSQAENQFDNFFDILNKKNFKKNIDEQVETCAKLILKAGVTVFMGMGASGSICEYASRKLASLGLNSFSLTDRSYPLQSRFSEEKLNVICILSVSGTTREMVEIAKSYVDDPNTKIIVITGDFQSKLANEADYVLDYVSDNDRTHIYYDLSSQIPCMFILELIAYHIRREQTL